MSNMIVVKKDANQEINPVYLDSLVRDGYNSWVSLTGIDNETNSITIQITDENQTLSAEELVEIQQSFPGSELYFAFGKKEEGFIRDNIQPFSVLSRGDSNSTVCAAFMLGEFPEFAKEGSHLHSAFYAMAEYLSPKLKKTARAFVCEPDYTNNDLDNFRDAISDGVERREFSKFIDAGDGGIILLVANGSDNTQDNVISHVKEGVLHEFSWGWTTNPLDYSEGTFPAKEEEKKSDDKPKSIFDRVQQGKKNATPATSTPAPAAPTTKTHDTTVEDLLGRFKIERRLSDGFMRPLAHPSGKHTNSYLKDVYKAICGATPANYKNLPFVKPTTAKATALLSATFKDFKEASGAILEKIKDTSSHHIPAQTETNKKEEVATKAETPPATTPPETPPTKDNDPPWEHHPKDTIPLLTAEAFEAMQVFHTNSGVQKLLDTSSFVIPSGGANQEKEKMLPSLCSKMKWELINTLKYPFEYAVALGQHNPKALAMLWNDVRNELLKRLTQEEKIAHSLLPKEEPAKKFFGGIKPRKSA